MHEKVESKGLYLFIDQYLLRYSIDNTVQGGYATSPYTTIRTETVAAAGMTDVSEHLEEQNGHSHLAL